ncbi:hypothetical protein [Actinomadura rubrisoli]|uniref:hypothetical protein n=1 Tax=Actinomadura rubrisoli TaxID=2530368 RepID=UPI00104AB94F|nr:hypothetical protein [Actinomadura rubrisoli]
MTSLSDLNREEWADKPYLIELRGGRMDGNRFRRNKLAITWCVPEIVEPSLVTDADGIFRPELVPLSIYRRTGIVTDDGVHIYQFEGIELIN